MSLDPGTKLGRYEVRSVLGAGTMVEVYRAQQTVPGRHLALRILPRDFAAGADRLRRFVSACRAWSDSS